MVKPPPVPRGLMAKIVVDAAEKIVVGKPPESSCPTNPPPQDPKPANPPKPAKPPKGK